jgi:hypothetical protein
MTTATVIFARSSECATSFTVLSSYSFIGQDISLLNRPSSGVQVVMVKDFAAHCNSILFPPIAVASGYFGYVGYHQSLYVCPRVLRGCSSSFCGLLDAAALIVLAEAGVLLCWSGIIQK